MFAAANRGGGEAGLGGGGSTAVNDKSLSESLCLAFSAEDETKNVYDALSHDMHLSI